MQLYGQVMKAYVPVWITFDETIIEYQANVILDLMVKDMVSPLLQGNLIDWEMEE